MDMRICAVAAALLGGLPYASPGAAQFPQYTAPGSLAVPQTPSRERVETSWRTARWDLGAVRVDPRIRVRDMGYSDNVFGAPEGSPQISDFSASAGVGLFGFYNRLTLIAEARRDERQRLLNSESLTPFDIRVVAAEDQWSASQRDTEISATVDIA